MIESDKIKQLELLVVRAYHEGINSDRGCCPNCDSFCEEAYYGAEWWNDSEASVDLKRLTKG